MQWLKQSTSATVKIGPFLDEDDGKTAETGLAIAQADVRLSKNGGDIAQKTEATSCTHDELGIYGCPFDTTDTATLGRLQLWVHESGALPVWHEFMVVPANVWDSFFGADYLHTNVAEISEDATAANNAEAFFDGTGYAGTNNVIPTVTTLTGHTDQTGDNYARLGAPAGASVSADIADVPTVAEFEARTLVTASYFDPGADAVANVTLVATTTTNTDMVGTDSAALASVCTEARLAELDAANLPTDIADVPTVAEFNARTQPTADYFDAANDAVANVTLVATTTTNTDMVGTNNAALASVCTETRLAELAAANLPTDIDAILADTGTDGVLLAAAATSAQLVDDVWDELLTGAAHNVATSAGRRLRVLAAQTVRAETAQAGTSTTITLDAAASATDQIYVGDVVVIVTGTGAEQARVIVNYVGSTKVATIGDSWLTTPDNTSEFIILAAADIEHTSHGVAQAGAAGSITLIATASAVNDFYNDQRVHIVTGTGAGQIRLVSDYDGTSKIASVVPNWATTPDNTSVYHTGVAARCDAGLIEGLDATDQVNAACDTALSDIHLDHLFATDYDPASKPGVATALLNELMESDAGVSRFTENALEQAPSGTGGDATEAKQDTIITHLTDVKGATFADTDSLEAIRNRGDAAWTTGSGGTAGSGAITFIYTLTSSVNAAPIAQADVWVTTDEAGANVIASGTTSDTGTVTFYLDAGTYYVWRAKSGWDFTNPDTEVVTA